MVLSNKKLKQKMRTAKAEFLVESDVHNKLTGKVIENSIVLKSETPDSPRILLSPVTHKLSMSKREKRRQKTQSLLQEKTYVLENNEIGGDAEREKEGKLKSAHEEVKKKRKRDGSKTPVDVDQNKVETLKKKKKPKNNRKPKKVENETVWVDGVEKNGSGRSGEQLVTKTDESIDRKYVEVSSKVYVGGIPYYSTEDDIRSYFECCGTITNVDCMEFPDTGKFRGIAIITFKTEAAAKRALALDGSDMGGLLLKIQPFRSARINKLSNFSPSVLEGYNRIYLGNLSWNITENDVREFFSDCSITSIRFGEDKETKEFKGYAHVDFADNLSLILALKLDQQVVCGRPVRISCAVPKKGTATTTSTEKESKIDTSKVSSVSDDKMNSNADTIGITEVSAVSSKIRRRTCYECGERGHISSSCPKKKAADSTNSSSV